MRVRDILDAPQLRMRLLHGDENELERTVARVCATDMPDPRPFVTAGALVCTGLVWRHDATDSDRYVGLLAEAGVVGVVAGQALHGRVPEDVVAACKRHGLPLLSAPQSVPFSRIIEYLAERAAEVRWRRVQSRADRQRRLLSAVAAGKGIESLVADFAAEQHVSAWLLTSTGTVVAGTEDLAESDLDRIVATALTAPRLPAVTVGAMRVLQVGAGDRITAWYLVFRPSVPELDPFGADLAAVAELYRQRRADRQHLDWELADRFPVPFAEQSDLGSVAIVCAARDGEVSAVRAVLHDALPGLATSIDQEGRLVGVTDGTQDGVAAVVNQRLSRIVPALNGVRLAVGVGARRPDETLAAAIGAASAACTAARDEAAPISLRVADIDSAVGLLTAVPGGLQRRFAERVLGPVLDYDRRHSAGLLDTLAIFLGCEGSWRQAADRMHLHLNTVRYRIGRIEELTGRDLGRIDDRLDLYLAVRTLAGQTAPV
ncbi:PucR family transcriptional regulator [Nocardia yunnanensis]|uniref:PucR family transcriptional regulator n=1 Tax=Nocardia yunnanensis TaxID=2382165 RepID=A0A386ZA90_9NOCA|nr:PucR family transcriptional regulator [Nocardia yunnanensis]AYF74024.1 PucR family transcriptional regulator [Nocardia yunnanensis]